MANLTNKVALVTGARRGMGKSHALKLASLGAKVAVSDISLEDCEAVAKEIKEKGGEAEAYKLDVSQKSEVDAVFNEIIKKFGRLDILVNNAGIYAPRPALNITEEDWNKTIGTNLTGEFFCAQRAAREMAKNNPQGGRIVNIASIASGQVGVGISGGAHYTASKGGILGMTETMAIEWAPLGINVNAVAPGAIDTPMTKSSGISPEAMNAFLQRIPLKRMGRAEEVSELVAFLVSDESSYITGATFYIDGGWLAN